MAKLNSNSIVEICASWGSGFAALKQKFNSKCSRYRSWLRPKNAQAVGTQTSYCRAWIYGTYTTVVILLPYWSYSVTSGQMRCSVAPTPSNLHPVYHNWKVRCPRLAPCKFILTALTGHCSVIHTLFFRFSVGKRQHQKYLCRPENKIAPLS